MFSKLTMVLSLVVLVSFVASPALAAPGDSWSLSGDFSITNGNPNQVGDGSWEYHTGTGDNLMDLADTDWYVAENPPNIGWHHSTQTGNPWVHVVKATDDYTNHNPAGCTTGCPQLNAGDVGGHGTFAVYFRNRSGSPATYNLSASGYNTRNDEQNMHRSGNLDITWTGGSLNLNMAGDANDNINGTRATGSASAITLADGGAIKAVMNYNDWSGLTLDVNQVPEPTSVLLMLVGGLGLMWSAGRRPRR